MNNQPDKPPKPMTEEELREFLKTARIKYAEEDKIDSFADEVWQLLNLLTAYMHWNPESVYVSDESSMSDFNLDQIDFADLSNKVGFPVSEEDYVWEVAAKMAKLGKKIM